eukprot:TRINITY_DN28151_c0_g1_i1.p2 TRINITY_DN28151_c0_g1~~TRINITY_DN28151_c0_g1_i1.p2  ORF type:complete len:138 (+),score=48.11 TRINITY_DN28151_c0_g1_i1:65-478(+)
MGVAPLEEAPMQGDPGAGTVKGDVGDEMEDALPVGTDADFWRMYALALLCSVAGCAVAARWFDTARGRAGAAAGLVVNLTSALGVHWFMALSQCAAGGCVVYYAAVAACFTVLMAVPSWRRAVPVEVQAGRVTLVVA